MKLALELSGVGWLFCIVYLLAHEGRAYREPADLHQYVNTQKYTLLADLGELC